MYSSLASLDVTPLWEEHGALGITEGAAADVALPDDLLKWFGPAEPREVDRQVMRLGCMMAALPFIHFQTLRLCRILLNPQIATYVEDAICRSQLVRGCGADGFSLAPSFRISALRMLRSLCAEGASELANDLQDLRERLCIHAGKLSPLLEIEAEIAWDYILLDESEFADRVNNRLLDVAHTAVEGKRWGMLPWVAGARSRLPVECIQGDAAWILCQLCNARKIEMAPVAIPQEPTASRLMAQLSDEVPTVVVGIRRESGSIEFGPPSGERNVGVTLINTSPIFIRIREQVSNGELLAERTLRLERGEEKRVECGNGELVIGDLTGRRFTLRAFEGDRSHEANRAAQALWAADQLMRNNAKSKAVVVRIVDAGYVVKLEPAQGVAGATAYLPGSPNKQMLVGDRLHVRVSYINHEKQWVLVYPEIPNWFKEISIPKISKRVSSPEGEEIIIPDDADPEEIRLFLADRQSILTVPVEQIPADVSPGDVFPATLDSHGPRRIYRYIHRGKLVAELRSAHVYIEPKCLLAAIKFEYRKGHTHKPGFVRFPGAVRRHGTEWLPPEGTAMEIVAIGVFSDEKKRGKAKSFWQLLLRQAKDGESAKRTKPVKTGDRLVATTMSVELGGAYLQDDYTKQRLWLPRNEIRPRLTDDAPVPLQAGDSLTVYVLGFDAYRQRGHYIVRQM